MGCWAPKADGIDVWPKAEVVWDEPNVEAGWDDEAEKAGASCGALGVAPNAEVFVPEGAGVWPKTDELDGVRAPKAEGDPKADPELEVPNAGCPKTEPPVWLVDDVDVLPKPVCPKTELLCWGAEAVAPDAPKLVDGAVPACDPDPGTALPKAGWPKTEPEVEAEAGEFPLVLALKALGFPAKAEKPPPPELPPPPKAPNAPVAGLRRADDPAALPNADVWPKEGCPKADGVVWAADPKAEGVDLATTPKADGVVDWAAAPKAEGAVWLVDAKAEGADLLEAPKAEGWPKADGRLDCPKAGWPKADEAWGLPKAEVVEPEEAAKALPVVGPKAEVLAGVLVEPKAELDMGAPALPKVFSDGVGSVVWFFCACS
jgi:hypothetical protein